MHVSTSFEAGEVEAPNVLADLPGIQQQEPPLLIGAHLDSVAGGPGINDNGSGVAAVLELAKQARRLGYRPQAPIRFAFWAGEEAGLYGSKEYVESLGGDAAEEIGAVVNLDMLGSPNAEAFVYEGDATIEETLTEAVRGEGLDPVPINLEGQSDHAPFRGGWNPGGRPLQRIGRAGRGGQVSRRVLPPCVRPARQRRPGNARVDGRCRRRRPLPLDNHSLVS